MAGGEVQRYVERIILRLTILIPATPKGFVDCGKGKFFDAVCGFKENLIAVCGLKKIAVRGSSYLECGLWFREFL